jgi:hypothetical protein
MATEDNRNAEHSLAQQSREKFLFYFVGLVFTLLAASIQSAKFSAYVAANIAELFSWVALLLSGIVTLSYLDREPLYRNDKATKNNFEKNRQLLNDLKENGEDEVAIAESNQIENVEKLLEITQRNIEHAETILKKEEPWFRRKYLIARWSFVLGLAALLVARAYEPLTKVLCLLR